MNQTTFIILGFSGDLAKRKLIPALYNLLLKKKIKDCLIIGAAFENTTMEAIFAAAKEFIDQPIDQKTWQLLLEKSFYQQLDFSNEADFKKLKTLVEELESKEKLPGNRLVYLAASSNFFCDITHNLAAADVVKKIPLGQQQWHRIVYEKPFGHDAKSAHEINACIENSFYEHQIYRVDHYLTKEPVSSIALLRFTNCVFEPLWNNRYIDNVQIVLSEQVGIEGRGAYYDSSGALSDVVQNHMLELLALIAMEAPEKLEGDFIRNERANVLKKVQCVDGILGQYDGYLQDRAVKPHSTTETFAALRLAIDNPRWAGVPFYLKTGKSLDKKETVIHVKFKQVECLLTKNCPSDSNYLTIQLYPDESFTLTLNTKKPNSQDLLPVAMEYNLCCPTGSPLPTAHQVLLEEVMRGEQSVSVRFDEIEYAWRIVDAIRSKGYKMYTYKQGTQGPKEAENFAQRNEMRWRS